MSKLLATMGGGCFLDLVMGMDTTRYVLTRLTLVKSVSEIVRVGLRILSQVIPSQLSVELERSRGMVYWRCPGESI